MWNLGALLRGGGVGTLLGPEGSSGHARDDCCRGGGVWWVALECGPSGLRAVPGRLVGGGRGCCLVGACLLFENYTVDASIFVAMILL